MFKKVQDFQNSGLWRKTYSISGVIISLAGVFLTLVIFITVVARYVFKKDIFGSEEIILFLAWWLYFIGGISGSQEDSQIKADMVEVFCSNQFIVDMARGIAKILEAIVFFFCTYLSGLMLATNFERMPVTTGLKIPYVCMQIPIAIGFLGMALAAVYWAIFYICRAADNKKGAADE